MLQVNVFSNKFTWEALEEHWYGREWWITLYYLDLSAGKSLRIWVTLVYTNCKSNSMYFRGKCFMLSFSFFPLSLSFWKTFPFLVAYKPARVKCLRLLYNWLLCTRPRRSRTPVVKAFGKYHWSQIQLWIQKYLSVQDMSRCMETTLIFMSTSCSNSNINAGCWGQMKNLSVQIWLCLQSSLPFMSEAGMCSAESGSAPEGCCL